MRYPDGVYVQHIVTWRKLGVEAPIFILFDGYPPRMDSTFYGRIRAVGGQASIELADIRMSDDGWYECSVLFLDGSDDVSVNGTWIHLTVNGRRQLVHAPLVRAKFHATSVTVTSLTCRQLPHNICYGK